MSLSIGIYSSPMDPIHLVGLYTTRLSVFRWKARGYDWILVDSIGQPSGIGAYKVGGAEQCSSIRRRYPWKPCKQPPPNRNLLWYLKKEGPVNRGEIKPPTPTTPSTKCSSCGKKQTIHSPNECSWRWEQHQKPQCKPRAIRYLTQLQCRRSCG